MLAINNKTEKIVYRFNPKLAINKTSFTVEENGRYRVCAQRLKSKVTTGKKVYVKINVESENSTDKNLDKALKNTDLNPITEKINKIISKSQNIIDNQKKETEIEDAFSTMQMSYTSNFITFACVQILAVLVIGIYHIYSFRKFLISNNLME